MSEASATGTAAASATPPRRSGTHRQRVAEEEREHDGQGDRRPGRPAERGADDHAEHLADRAAREAVQGRREGESVERLLGVPAMLVVLRVGRHEDFTSRPTAAISSSVRSAWVVPELPITQWRTWSSSSLSATASTAFCTALICVRMSMQ